MSGPKWANNQRMTQAGENWTYYAGEWRRETTERYQERMSHKPNALGFWDPKPAEKLTLTVEADMSQLNKDLDAALAKADQIKAALAALSAPRLEVINATGSMFQARTDDKTLQSPKVRFDQQYFLECPMKYTHEDRRYIVPEPGSLWKHYNGGVYRVLHLTNDDIVRKGHPIDVVYENSDNSARRKKYSRRLTDWHRSFTKLPPFNPTPAPTLWEAIVSPLSHVREPAQQFVLREVSDYEMGHMGGGTYSRGVYFRRLPHYWRPEWLRGWKVIAVSDTDDGLPDEDTLKLHVNLLVNNHARPNRIGRISFGSWRLVWKKSQ